MKLRYVKERFLAFAESECKGNSGLYYKLSIQISNDDELSDIASYTRPGQPVPRQDRDFYFLSVEGIKELLERYHSKEIVIELTTYKNRQKTETFLAETNGHGNWIKWK